MQETQKKPLAMGLLGRSSGSVYAQMEICLKDYNTIDFIIRRKSYSNLPDVEFSMDIRDLEDIIDVLKEAKKKLDNTVNVDYFSQLEAISTPLQKEEKKKSVEPSVKPREKKEKGPVGCPNYLGYLATRPIDDPLPQECRVCPEVLDCAMKTSDS